MTLHPIHAGLAIWLLLLLWRLGRGVRSGEYPPGGFGYRRDGQPVEYWLALLFEVGLALALLWWAYGLAARGWNSGAVAPLLLLVGTASLVLLLRALWIGSTRLRNDRIDRRARPRLFWSLMAIQLALTGGVFWLALSPAGPEREQRREVYAVAKAVRASSPEARNAEFSRVRMDARSRRVCGEFKAGGATRRFFGSQASGNVTAVIEDRSLSGFEDAYRRACGSGWIMPQAG
jgi:hypothetical protein